MIRKIRLILRETPVFRKTLYGFIRWVANDVFHYRCRILQKFGYQALSAITEAQKETGVRCYADFGTLLGIIRDGGFIKHDDDMDFTLLPPHNRVKEFYQALVSRGFVFERYLKMDNVLKEFSVRYKEISIDFFLQIYSDDGTSLDYVDEKRGDYWTRYQYAAPSKLIEYKIHGVSAVIPENYDCVLTSEYGNWGKVIKQWNSNMVNTVMQDVRPHVLTQSRDINEWHHLLGM